MHRRLLRNKTAIELEAARLRNERAQHAAVDAERLRIARDMHDTVSQSLFGLAFGLQGTQQLLPDHPEEAKQRLGCISSGRTKICVPMCARSFLTSGLMS